MLCFAMKTRLVAGVCLMLVGSVILGDAWAQTAPATADIASSGQTHIAASEKDDLASIVQRIEPISREQLVRRRIAQMTFCLPQTVLGVLFYAGLQLTGMVRDAATLNEVTVIEMPLPAGVSLGGFVFVGTPLLTENVVRHEYGHVLQGYHHGPFYLLLEGVASLAQAVVSILSPTFAAGYYERWPESEANELGGVH